MWFNSIKPLFTSAAKTVLAMNKLCKFKIWSPTSISKIQMFNNFTTKTLYLPSDPLALLGDY